MSEPADQPDIADLRRENERLRSDLAAVRDSLSFRLGHALVRNVARVARGRTGPARRRGGAASRTATGAAASRPAPASPEAVHVSAEGPAAEPVGPATAETAGTAATGEPVPEPVAPAAEGTPDPAVVALAALDEPEPRWPLPTPRADADVRDRATVRPLPTGDPDGVPPGPVFVGGTGRSGTWVIGRLLRSHPDWTCVHTELRFHTDPEFAAVLRADLDPRAFADHVIDRHLGLVGAGGRPKGLQLVSPGRELRKYLDRFVERAGTDRADALGELLLDVVEPYARGRGALGWSETTPGNAAVADVLLTVLPKARLVHTVRDGRDAAASVVHMPWGPDTIEEALVWWARRLLEGHAGSAAADPARVHTVRLEELVHLARDESLEALVRFAGFVDGSAMQAYLDEHIDARRGNVGRWRAQVDVDRRDRVDGLYRDLLDRLRDAGVACLPTDPKDVDELARRQHA